MVETVHVTLEWEDRKKNKRRMREGKVLRCKREPNYHQSTESTRTLNMLPISSYMYSMAISLSSEACCKRTELLGSH